MCTRHGPGGDAALRGRSTGLRPDNRERFLLRHAPVAAALRGRLSRRSKPRWPRSSKPIWSSSASKSRAKKPLHSAATSASRSRSSTSEKAWPTTQTLSFYRQGEFVDLCRGRHVPATGAIGAFKLLTVAGAYWKGDQTREQLQRLYGTAFFSKEDLDAHLQAVEEAKRRDHRVLGKQLELFTTSPLVGQGLILWLPKGAIIRGLLESFVTGGAAPSAVMSPVYTPNIGRVELYQISGHYPYYADSQFKPIVMSDEEKYILKPMNCPHHIMIYKSKPRSYRELAGAAGGIRHRVSL